MVGLDNLDRLISIIRQAASNASAVDSLRNGRFLLIGFMSLHIVLRQYCGILCLRSIFLFLINITPWDLNSIFTGLL